MYILPLAEDLTDFDIEIIATVPKLNVVSSVLCTKVPFIYDY